MKSILILLVFTCALSAQVPPSAISVSVSQTDAQEKEYQVKRKSGEHDYRIDRRRMLRIRCQVAMATPQPLTVRWHFIAREKLNNKNRVWSAGERDVSADRIGVAFVAESDPLPQEVATRSEGANTLRTTSSLVPHGWAVEVLSAGRVVKVVESSSGILKRAAGR